MASSAVAAGSTDPTEITGISAASINPADNHRDVSLIHMAIPRLNITIDKGMTAL